MTAPTERKGAALQLFAPVAETYDRYARLLPFARVCRMSEEAAVAVCDICGNDYDKSFEVRAEGKTHTFDSFECAIQALAPICAHCGCRVIGHGLESNGRIFCCAHCAGQEGVSELRDRA